MRKTSCGNGNSIPNPPHAFTEGIYDHPFTICCNEEGCGALLSTRGPTYWCETHQTAKAKPAKFSYPKPKSVRGGVQTNQTRQKKVAVSVGTREAPAQEVNLPVYLSSWSCATAVRKFHDRKAFEEIPRKKYFDKYIPKMNVKEFLLVVHFFRTT